MKRNLISAVFKAGWRIPLCYIAWMKRYANHPEKYPISLKYRKLRKIVSQVAYGLGMDIIVSGKENIPNVTCAYFSNHIAAVDPLRCHADSLARTHQAAKVASHAFRTDKFRLAGLQIEFYGLVATVIAGDGTSAASYALLLVETWKEYRIPLQFIMLHDGVLGYAYQGWNTSEPHRSHVIIQTGDQVLDDPVAILHHCSGNLEA